MPDADRPVLIAFDGSEAARAALAETAGILRPGRTLVVTVWEEGLAYMTPAMPPDGMMMTPMVDPSVAQSVDEGIHEHAETVARAGAELAKSLGLNAQPLAVPDDRNVAETILNLAREHNAAAIVVGSRGLSGLKARLEGSTSKSLLKHAHCPVIVVHDPGDPDHSHH